MFYVLGTYLLNVNFTEKKFLTGCLYCGGDVEECNLDGSAKLFLFVVVKHTFVNHKHR